MKVLHGMSEVANQASYSVVGLRSLGVEARTAIWSKNRYAAIAPDIDLKINKRKPLLFPWYGVKMFAFGEKALREYDTFHFHATYSAFPFNLDLDRLDRDTSKQYFFEYHGTDLRGGEPWRKNPYHELCTEFLTPNSYAKRNAKIFSHNPRVIIHDEELRPYLPSNLDEVYVIPLRANIESIEPSYPLPEKHRPLIVHAPSAREYKGSSFVLETLERLSEQYDFEVRLVEGYSNQEALAIYREADIIIDQLIIGVYGVFAIEAMTLGKPVVAYIRDDYVDMYPSGMPVVNANKDTLAQKLAQLIEDASLRADLGRRGREYVSRYHDCRRVARLLKATYEGSQGPLSTREAFEWVGSLAAYDSCE